MSAYYVASIFQNIADMQSKLDNIKHPNEFLDCFIAIDANTTITKKAKAAKATDIQANDAVEVVASKGEGDALTAVTIKVG